MQKITQTKLKLQVANKMLINILKLLRPHQWLKNFAILLPLFFSGHLSNLQDWTKSIIAFFAFSFVASSIYCFNDICDIEADQEHPEKCKRPLASGALSKFSGYVLMLVCLLCSIVIIICFGEEKKWNELIIILFYFLMNIAYTLKLKDYPIIDVFIISFGFVLRVIMGGISTGIFLSHWIIMMAFLLALFLAFAKRRDDVAIYKKTGIKPRKITDRYNLDFMNQILTVVATITIVCYIMYTVSEEVINRLGSHYIYITVIFVLGGILRYLQLTMVDSKSGSPTKILMKDLFIQLCIASWIVTFIIIIYL
jgi:decaprenyl-phosphate phosphoribosyltransferase